MLKIKSHKFYVYIYYDPRPDKDEVPVYVGKGKEGRSHVHWINGSHNLHLDRMLDQCKAMGLMPIVEILDDLEDETEAFAYEAALIATFGRLDLGTGTLYNLTDGWEGTSGHTYKHTVETRKKMSDSKKGKPLPIATMKAAWESRVGVAVSDETKKKMSESQKRRKRSPDIGKAISKAKKGKPGKIPTEETRRKMGLAHLGNQNGLGYRHTEEAKQKISLASKGKKLLYSTKQKISTAGKGLRYITNGFNNRKVSTEDIIPDGWRLGLTKNRATSAVTR